MAGAFTTPRIWAARPPLLLSITLDKVWNAYVAGTTDDPGFPVTPGASQKDYEGFSDAFVTKIVIAGDLQTIVALTTPTQVGSVRRNGVVIYNARIKNNGPDGSDKVVVIDAIPAGMSYAEFMCRRERMHATANWRNHRHFDLPENAAGELARLTM